MTAGYLLDLYIINQVRKEELGEEMENDVKFDLNRQDGHLLREIGKMLIEVADGHRPGTFAKHKVYDQGVGEMDNDNLIVTLHKLYERHRELWYLEDLRRDLNNSDKTRLEACDRVSIANKKRNDLVENVDRIINNRLKQTKIWGATSE
tara:strand:+ start:143 stop:589 length:447 start_codon:yes stop_codon:yes gene_type:complete